VSRLALIAALEALEAGDTRLAVDVLLGAVEEIDNRPARNSKRPACPSCRLAFEWPGQVEDHLRLVHPREEAA